MEIPNVHAFEFTDTNPINVLTDFPLQLMYVIWKLNPNIDWVFDILQWRTAWHVAWILKLAVYREPLGLYEKNGRLLSCCVARNDRSSQNTAVCNMTSIL